jgi:hypothetical protein
VTRTELEVLARRYMGASMRLDGLGETAAKLVVLKAAMPHTTLSTATPAAYLDAALDALAGNAAPAASAAPDAVDTAGASGSAARAFAAMKRDAEDAWRGPLRATRDEDTGPRVAERRVEAPPVRPPPPAQARRGDAAEQPGAAAAARARMIADSEAAWRQPCASAELSTEGAAADE